MAQHLKKAGVHHSGGFNPQHMKEIFQSIGDTKEIVCEPMFSLNKEDKDFQILGMFVTRT